MALSTDEWQALCCRVQQPPLRQAVRLIAGLGGFLGRKHDAEPGILTLWRGLTRLQDIAHDYHLFARRL